MDATSPRSSPESLPEGFLTPRSKVAKLLADIDNGPTPSPSKTQTLDLPGQDQQTRRASQSPCKGVSQKQTAARSSPQAASDKLNAPSRGSSSDESEDDVRRPNGRAARRMAASSGKPPGQASSPMGRDGSVEDADLYSVTPAKRTAGSRPTSPSPAGTEAGGTLFVSPARPDGQMSETESPFKSGGAKGALAELVAQKRAERLAKQSAHRKKSNDSPTEHASSDLPEGNNDDDEEAPDPELEKIMSDASKPSRKASKKALLEMERETQRISRQQALAHQMKTKKKFTTNDLFAKFNFRRNGNEAAGRQEPSPGKEWPVSSTGPSSDNVEERSKQLFSTPPSSPPTPLDRQKALVDHGALSKLVPVRQDSIAAVAENDKDNNDDIELQDMSELVQASRGIQSSARPPEEDARQEKKGFKLARFGKRAAVMKDDESDDELEILAPMPRHLQVFEKYAGANVPGKTSDSKAVHHLKHFSNFNTHESAPQQNKGARPSLNSKALENQLRRRAKEQARQQQQERVEELKAKGIEVQSTEEREKEAELFENLLEKARQEAQDLRKLEKSKSKAAGGEGAADASEDEDEDEDYVGSDSGDEHEDDEGALLDGEAEEDGDENEDEEDFEGTDDETEHDGRDKRAEQQEEITSSKTAGTVDGPTQTPRADTKRKSRKSRIVEDDDDESHMDEAEMQELATPAQPASTSRPDPFAAFNFGGGNIESALLSPTQAFNATMQTPTQATQEDSMDILGRIAPPSESTLPPTLPDMESQGETQPSYIADSQVPRSQRIQLDWETQAPETPAPAGMPRAPSGLSETPGWEPTQDSGLPSPWAARPGNFEPDSAVKSNADQETQSTVRVRISESPAPGLAAPKRGRLVRRPIEEMDESDDESATVAPLARREHNDAFREMAKRRKQALTDAERAEAGREAREMMDEAAEESEDEYAGLGGDDFVAPETEEDKEIIDSSHVDVNERQIAAHFAERERVRNEEETSKLYKDLTTGGLRRRTGANAFDLDEDEDELAARRRQMRQREEAKKRKALLKDENVATLAEGKSSKGKDAFLKALADDDENDEVIDLSDAEDEGVPATQEDSQQSQPQQQANQPLQETSGNKRQRTENEQAGERPPAKQRRTQASTSRKPANMLEVRESVSFLLEEPNAAPLQGPTALELSDDDDNSTSYSDSDNDDEQDAEASRQNDGGFAPNPASAEAQKRAMPPPRAPASQRRTPALKAPVLDRLALKRDSSSSSSEGALGRSAWASGPQSGNGGPRVASLLRRASTNTATSANDRGVTVAPALTREGSSGSGGMKSGGSKKSSLAYQARAEERRAIVEAGARKREENTARIAKLRRQGNSEGLSGRPGFGGRFE